MTTCHTCNGRRIVSEMVPETRTATIFHSFPVHEGTERTRVTAETGRMVKRNYQCGTCSGTGRIECQHCEGTGHKPVPDAHGDYDSVEWCHCDIGDIAREDELAEHDAVSAAEFDVMAAHAAFAGITPANPPLDEQPF